MSVSFFLNLAVNVDFKLQINNLSGTVHSEESKWTTMEMMSFDPEYFFLGGGAGGGGGGQTGISRAYRKSGFSLLITQLE